MKRFPQWWFAAALLLLSMPALAGKTLIASGKGELVVDVDGSVADVTLKDGFGPEIDAHVRQRLLKLRFEPVVEGGRAVQAVGRMMFDLAATFDDDDRFQRLEITRLGFLDPPGTPTDAGRRLTPPRYPSNALRHALGARVLVRVEIGADGSVLRAAPEEGTLIVHASRVNRAPQWMKLFHGAAIEAVRGWTFEPGEDGKPRQAKVPMHFSVSGQPRWLRAHEVPVAPEPWMLEVDPSQLAEYGPAGEVPDVRLKLLTPLDSLESAGG